MPQVTVTEHLLLHQKKSPAATGVFTQLLYDLIVSAKLISRNISQAGLLDVIGETGTVNVQGERVQKMDEYANRVLIHRMERSGALCMMASEENADAIKIPPRFSKGEYLLVFDPLDGSSNIDVNINVGTIFSILRRRSPHDRDPDLSDLLQPGFDQVAAGYFLYGPSTMMVFSTGEGLHAFTLDPTVGEFLLAMSDITIPEQGKIYSVNEGHRHLWSDKAKQAVDYFKGTENRLKQPYSMRYVGSLVADFHRTIMYGGVFMYPKMHKPGQPPKGKLRYLCEAAPLAFLAEHAGGLAIDGDGHRILELRPTELHQRVPLYIGSKNDVEDIASILA